MKKACSMLLTVGLFTSAFSGVSYAQDKDVNKSFEYGKVNSPANHKSHFLPSVSPPGKVSAQAGTIVGIETNIYLYQGTLASYGLSTCSQTCSELRVANYLVRGAATILDWDTDANYNDVSAIAVSKGGTYSSGYNYHSYSDHHVVDYYGQSVMDRTIDDDL